MKNYLYSLILTAIGGGVAFVLAPEGEKNGLKERVGFVVSLFLILTLISPVMKTVKMIENLNISSVQSGVSSFSENTYESVFSETLTSVTENTVTDATAVLLTDEFGINKKNNKVSVQIAYDNEIPKIEKITVILSGSGLIRNPRTIEKRISEYFSCDCDVIT